MKRFYVSGKCIACGECAVRTNQLIESPDGHAIPANDAYINDGFLPQAQEIVAMCPVGALEIREYSSTTAPDISGAKELAKILEQQLKSIVISEISERDIPFNANDYSVSYGYADGENQFRYSSESSAKQAANKAFETTFWNHRSDYVLSLLTQYKSKVLRPYYDFNSKDNFFLRIINQFEIVLQNIRCEAESLTNGLISLPENSFCVFSADLSDVKRYMKEHIAVIETYYLVKNLLEALGRENLHRLKDYEDRFYIDSQSEVIGHNWLGDKLKWTYDFEGVNEEGQTLVSDVKFALEYSESYGVRCVDERSAEEINFAIYLFKKAVEKEIIAKIEQYNKAVSNLA